MERDLFPVRQNIFTAIATSKSMKRRYHRLTFPKTLSSMMCESSSMKMKSNILKLFLWQNNGFIKPHVSHLMRKKSQIKRFSAFFSNAKKKFGEKWISLKGKTYSVNQIEIKI